MTESTESQSAICPTCRLELKDGENCPEHGLSGISVSEFLKAKGVRTQRYENRKLPRSHRKPQDPTTF